MSDEIEEWRPVVGYEGRYEVSNFGRVKSLPREMWNGFKMHPLRGRILKPGFTTGYAAINLHCGTGTGKLHYIHRLVAAAFIGESRGLEVNHKDGNKKNNLLPNLEYVTTRENARHARAMGLKKSQFGEDAPRSSITANQSIKIREMLACGMSVREIRDMTGYTYSIIKAISIGQTWKQTKREFSWQHIALALQDNS